MDEATYNACDYALTGLENAVDKAIAQLAAIEAGEGWTDR